MKRKVITLTTLGLSIVAGLSLRSIGRPPAAAYSDSPPSASSTDEDPGSVDFDRIASSGDGGSRVEIGTDPDPKDLRWITGRIQVPPGAPSDDSLQVVAVGNEPKEPQDRENALPDDRSWDSREVLARVAVEGDGSFRLAVPPAPEGENDRVALDLDGRFLFLNEPAELDPADLSREVELAPELGGAIRVTLELPEGATDLPSSVYVGAHGRSMYGAGMYRSAFLAGDLRFEFRGLLPEIPYALWANADIFPGVVHDDEPRVEAGQVLEVRIPLLLGSAVCGHVFDESGQPVAGVEIVGNVAASFWRHPDAGTTHTDKAGHFKLRGLSSQEQRLSITAEGYLAGESDVLPLDETSKMEDLRIQIDSGEELRGAIQWPDGTAAADARLTVIPLESNQDMWRLVQKAKSDEGSAVVAADGSFVVTALPPGSYGVYAWSTGGPAAADTLEWSARESSIKAGRHDLVLTLQAPVSFTSRVIDDAGQPVGNFSVEARRNDWPGYVEGPSSSVNEEFEATDGAFDLRLDSGEWYVSIRAEGYLGTDEELVTTPTTRSTPYRLTRTAQIRGVVYDPSGVPVADTEVRAVCDSQGHTGVVTTDAEGRFAFDSVGPGALRVSASSETWAPSVEKEIEMVPGQIQTEWVIRLTSGGSLRGVVYNSDGNPDPDRAVMIQSMEGDMRQALTEADGRFLAEHLAPGRYQVIAQPDIEEMESGGENPGNWFVNARMASATVVDNQIAEVVLGAPPRAPVLVNGLISRDGQSVANASFMVFPEQGRLLEGMGGGSSNEAGEFEVTLDEPGNYTFVVLDPEIAGGETDFQVTVPEASQHRLQLDLPAGLLSGRVVGPDGSAPEYGTVWVRREDGTSLLSPFMGSRSMSFDSDGSFEFEGLQPGTYAVTAIGTDAGYFTLHGVVVSESQGTSDLVLQVGEAGTVHGVIRDELGEGVADAVVFLRDKAGRTLFHLDTMTDSDGTFSMERVPSGEVYVAARTSSHVVDSRTATVIYAGQPSEVDLTLELGVLMNLDLMDEAGEPIRAAIQVHDENGHEALECASRSEMQRFFESDEFPSYRRVGPLRPGIYAVTATSADGLTKTAEIELVPGSVSATIQLTLR